MRLGLNSKPSAEQLRAMGVRELRDTFEIGMQEAKRMKLVQDLRDRINTAEASADVCFVLDRMLDLIEGEA